MKNFLLAITLLFFSVTIFSSCKKAYRCSCEDGNIKNPYIHKLNKSQAKSEKEKCEWNEGCVFERDKQ